MLGSDLVKPEEIKIIAEPLMMEPQRCRFSLEQDLVAGGSFRFSKDGPTAGSVLPQKILSVEEIANVFISKRSLIVTKLGYEDWRIVGPKVGKAIREALASGEMLVATEITKNIPSEQEIKSRVEQILEEEINPAVASHGGYIKLLDVKANDIFIEMGGGCQGCASSTYTLKQGVEQSLRQAIPQLGSIYDTTDHAAGQNPYYHA